MKNRVCGKVLLSGLIFLAACRGGGGATIGGKYLPDTPENRKQAAAEYLKVVSMRDMMDDVADKMSQQMPPDKRAEFITLMKTGIDYPALEKAAQESMVKHFTVAEVEALRNFYASPQGKSAMKKMGDYMADIMPIIRTQVVGAVGKLKEPAGSQPPAQLPAAADK